MATISSNPSHHYIFNSAIQRNLPSEFIGNSHWDYALQNGRLKRFLSRNMTRVRMSHRKRSAKFVSTKQTQTRETQTKSTKSINDISEVNGITSNGTNHIDGVGRSAVLMPKPVVEALPEHDTSVSALEAMSEQALLVKHKSDNYDSNPRKSLRTLLHKQHEDPNASLIVGMSNIRKRLNWKDTKSAQDMPPRKKQRLESIECDAYLAIWDKDDSNPNAIKIPIVSKREFCELVKHKRDANSAQGDFVEVKLDRPFVVPQRELRVPAKNGKDRTALAKEYFMEIKIVPRDENVPWPPIKMLGKSDGERFNGMGTDAKNEITTSMIARYKHLPTAPEPDTPLEIFVYAEGTIFRTKYGLEVSSRWLRKDHPDLVRRPSPEPDLESWALDDDRKPFGRPDPNRKPVSHAARKSAPATKRSTVRISKEPKITYNIQVPKGAKKEFNKFSVTGLKCSSCSGRVFANLGELRFHLDQNHKNRVTIEDEVIDPNDSRLISATIKVETPTNLRLKAIQGEQEEEIDKDLNYVAPTVPFDLDAHYTGKASPWTELLPAQLSKEAAKAPLVPATDAQSVLRRENKGHVPYRHVLPFRPQEYHRKKFPNKKLLTKHVSLENPYTSISHRPISLYNIDEDARSETDDEIDDTWFVDRHLEELDVHSWQKDWPDARRRLAKRWDYHILRRERGIIARYLGDCLIRFVRMEKKWILRENTRWDDEAAFLEAQTESVSALMDMMEELKNMRVINENVCSDVLTMLYSEDDIQVPVEEQREIEALANDVLKRKHQIRRNRSVRRKERSETSPVPESESLPSDLCAECRLPIGYGNQRAVRCSSLKCSSPNVWYHAKCAGLSISGLNPTGSFDSTQAVALSDFMKTRLAWKCSKCINGKGKERAIPPVPTMTRTDILMETEEPITQTSMGEEERSEIAAEDSVSRSASVSLPPSLQPDQKHDIRCRDVQDDLQSRRAVYSAYVQDRKSLRNIVLHHYHDQNNCIYAIIDERPTRSRSKKPHTVLAVVQEDKPASTALGNVYWLQFPDATKKSNTERWLFYNDRPNFRSLEAEVLARFRPYKVQHYVHATECQTESCNCVLQDSNLRKGGCLQLDPKRINDCKYGSGTQTREPGRGYYWGENNHGSVWYGDYFDELRKIAETDQRVPCKETSHLRCNHSITLKLNTYKRLVLIHLKPWGYVW